MTDIEKFMVDDIICPYCGWKDTDSWESNLNHDGECETLECPDCYKKFLMTFNLRVSYTLNGLCKENGDEHDWESFDFERSDGKGRCKGRKCLTCGEHESTSNL